MDNKKLLDAFKTLDEEERVIAIKEFLLNNIKAMATINKNIGNKKGHPELDIHNKSDLDDIYELLLLMTNEVSGFTEFIEDRFYE